MLAYPKRIITEKNCDFKNNFVDTYGII